MIGADQQGGAIPKTGLPDGLAQQAQRAIRQGHAVRILALLSLLSLRSAAGVAVAWIFSLWGSADLINSFYQAGHAGLLAGSWGPHSSFRLWSCRCC
jgi:hypothetical protein